MDEAMNVDRLDRNERIVVLYLIDGLSAYEIALILKKSHTWVQNTIKSIKERWNVNTINDIILKAGEFGHGYLRDLDKYYEDIEPVSLKIIAIPTVMNNRYDLKEFRQILTSLKYTQNPHAMDEFIIRNRLVRHPEYLAVWLDWSEQNASDGCYLRKKSHSRYEIGIRSGYQRLPAFSYSSPFSATAMFIKLLLEQIRQPFPTKID